MKRQATSVVIITGAGKAFCVGADLKERTGISDSEKIEVVRHYGQALSKLEMLPQVVIAAVNGFALGGGCELALACDLRIASADAFFALPELNVGMIPGAGGLQRLPCLIGRGRAKELTLTGRRIGASEALSLGLVEKVTESNNLMEETWQMANTIARKAPLALSYAKKYINLGLEIPLPSALCYELDGIKTILMSEDYR
ncbi:MAG: enoyl-CoA hydratase [Syntrophomonadaceae bacterium]|nr:enoyl-CoA hydratase [Syntrophomonadaceae bacterium]